MVLFFLFFFFYFFFFIQTQIQSALREMQTDPSAFQGYMQQPDVAAKINKLIQSGILQVGQGPRK